MQSREERERDLVALLIHDRQALMSRFKEIRGVDPQEVVDTPSDYDLVHQILDFEYSDEPGDEGESQRWMDARSST
jgi:hypothetical protein